MKKEEFIKLGINEELAVKAEAASQKELEDYVQKSKYNEVSEENKTLKKSVSDRDKQLEDLKKSSGDNATLQLDNAVEIALSGAKAKNGKAVKAMLDLSKVKLGEDGKLSGFEEQIEALKKSDGYMFDIQEQTQQKFTGFQPGASSTVPNSTISGYETRLADARKNNNQLEVIKIKQEAAAEGVVLI